MIKTIVAIIMCLLVASCESDKEKQEADDQAKAWVTQWSIEHHSDPAAALTCGESPTPGARIRCKAWYLGQDHIFRWVTLDCNQYTCVEDLDTCSPGRGFGLAGPEKE